MSQNWRPGNFRPFQWDRVTLTEKCCLRLVTPRCFTTICAFKTCDLIVKMKLKVKIPGKFISDVVMDKRGRATQLRIIKYEHLIWNVSTTRGPQHPRINSERNDMNHKLEIAQVKLRHWSGWMTAISALGKNLHYEFWVLNPFWRFNYKFCKFQFELGEILRWLVWTIFWHHCRSNWNSFIIRKWNSSNEVPF